LTYTVNDIASITGAETSATDETIIEHLLFDSRKIFAVSSSLFFALKGFRKDGHQFIPELYKKGVRHFVISESVDKTLYAEAVFLKVPDTLAALQQFAAHHRKQFNIPVIGITGSNGKTIVKEWLYQLLHEDYSIVRSPKSYNSQIGVPLSVWGMNEKHTLAIFEAGISRPGEMEKLQQVILPTIVVLTNIGEAHSEGFTSLVEKEKEKRKLFTGATEPAELFIQQIDKQETGTFIQAKQSQSDNEVISIKIPFTDEASIQNAITCWRVLLMLGCKQEVIQQRMLLLTPVDMRLELKKGINHCSIINDSYSADLSSLEIALNFLEQQSGGSSKTIILSDFLQSALPDEQLYKEVAGKIIKHKVKRIIAIGERIAAGLKSSLPVDSHINTEYFSTTNDFLQQYRSSLFRDEVILIKGARVFTFERIVQLLEQKAHQTILEINLNAIVHNLKEYQKLLTPSTKIMAMVKAFAYGSGGAEIAGILQYHKVDYLGVAYADEGVELRKTGITTPIMVMNPEESTFEAIVEYNLEPEIYSFELLSEFISFLDQQALQQYPIHIEVETGMNRLGFAKQEIAKLSAILKNSEACKVQTVFSHLAASEDAGQDEFTRQQFDVFKQASAELTQQLGYSFINHIANSAAAVRHPQLQMDMVRLGIGLYGVDSAATNTLNLQTVATLKSTVAQIKKLKAGDSVSYNRKSIVHQDTIIATIRIGYADGYPRRLGNGVGHIIINNQQAPIIGTVCMDMFMVDITHIKNVKEGDDVIVFGKALPVAQLATWAGTIPYEIMTGISQRVKRVYFEE
jgi:Alr-MurF fusion protein